MTKAFLEITLKISPDNRPHVNADSKLTHFCSERRFKTDTPPLHLNTA